MIEKLSRLKKSLASQDLNSLFITNYFSIFYLSNFRGHSQTEREAYLLYSSGKFHLVAPRLYQAEAKALKGDNLKVYIAYERNELYQTLNEIISKSKDSKIGFEADDLKVIELKRLAKELKGKKLIPTDGLVSKMREVKTEDEIELLRKAQEISYKAFKNVTPIIKPGVSEKELAAKLKSAMEELGAEDVSFDAIVASGAGCALPHYSTSTKKLQKGEMVLFDFGAKYKGYCGDTTRMVFLGKPTDRMVNIYNLVRKSQDDAIKSIKAGVKCSEPFNVANKVFVDNKVSENFTHGLGHGIGIDVHEEPYLRRTMHEPLVEGQVFSVEPGLYFEGWGGIRIEDLVVCGKNKGEVLSNYTTDIVIL